MSKNKAHTLEPLQARFTPAAIHMRACAQSLGMACPQYASGEEVLAAADKVAVELLTQPERELSSYHEALALVTATLRPPKAQVYVKAKPAGSLAGKALRPSRRRTRRLAKRAARGRKVTR